MQNKKERAPLWELKRRLRKKFGSLRAAAHELKISSWRLSSIIGGWIEATTEEQETLGMKSCSKRNRGDK